MKHTPGPWRYWAQRRDPYDTCTFRNQAGEEVLRVVTTTITEADARLIAAAPDLLDSLTNLLNRIELEGCTPLDWPAFEAGRAAIKKATGETE